MKPASFILLDIGGTDIKSAVVYAGENKINDLRRISFPKFLSLDSAYKEIDSGELLALAEAEIDWHLKRNKNIEAILLSGQMACWKISNSKNSHQNRIISWQDKRGAHLKPAKLNNAVLQANGGESKIGLPGLGLIHFLDNGFEIDEFVTFETMNSWLAQALCAGGTKSKTHVTDAAATGIYGIYIDEWIPDLLDSRMCVIQFPEVKKNMSTVGILKNSTIPVLVPVGDQQASLLGAGLENNKIVVNIGTGGQVATIRQGEIPVNWLVRPYFFDQYIVTKTHLPAGRLISTMVDLLENHFNSPINYESLSGIDFTRSAAIPIQELNPEDCERIFREQISFGQSVGEVVSLILKSIATVYVDAIKSLRGYENYSLLFAGGLGQKMENFHKFFELELGIPCEVAETTETTLQGLANLSTKL